MAAYFKSRMDEETRPQQKSLICGICNRVYTSKKLLVKHLHKHEHPPLFSCTECGKTFPTKTRLNIHIRVHSGERPFKCAVCHIYFASVFQLKLHRRRHTGEKPYSCSYCKKKFSSSSGLRQHLKTHTKETPFSCSHCSKSFKQKEKLSQHERIHTGVKPFMCDRCPMTFRVKNTLVRHLRIHSGDTFKCGLCPKEFGELYALKKHHRSKHNKLPFTGPSKRSVLKDLTKMEQSSVSNESILTNSILKVKCGKRDKIRAKVSRQVEKKQEIRVSNSSSKHKLKRGTSDSDLDKDVIEKLYLAIGQRDTSAVVDENGWHRIPLTAASNLLVRNTETGTKSCRGKEESSPNLRNREQDEDDIVQTGTRSFVTDTKSLVTDTKSLVTDTKSLVTDTKSLVTELRDMCDLNKGCGLDGSCRTNDKTLDGRGREVTTAGLHDVVASETSRPEGSYAIQTLVSQQKEQTSVRSRKALTHSSTIEYFPSANQTFKPAYTSDRENFQFLNNSHKLSFPPQESREQGSVFEGDHFKDAGIYTERLCSESQYQRCQFQHHHDQQFLQSQGGDHQSFYHLELSHSSESVLSETVENCCNAALHHGPNRYLQNQTNCHPQNFNAHQEQCTAITVQGEIRNTGGRHSWQPCQYNSNQMPNFENPCLARNHVPEYYKLVPLASFAEPLQPTSSLSSANFEPTSSSLTSVHHQPASSSLRPEKASPSLPLQHSLEVKSAPSLEHQDKSVKSSQPFVHNYKNVKSNELLFQHHKPVISNQQLLLQHVSINPNQTTLDHQEHLKSNQQQLFSCSLCCTEKNSMLNISNQQPLLSPSTAQQTHFTGSSSFSSLGSSVIHHKPEPRMSCDNHVSCCQIETWPMFQIQQENSSSNHNLIRSVTKSVTDAPVKNLSTCQILKNSFTVNQFHVNNTSDIGQSFDMPKRTSCDNNISECDTLDNICFACDSGLNLASNSASENNLVKKSRRESCGTDLQCFNMPLRSSALVDAAATAEHVKLTTEDLMDLNTSSLHLSPSSHLHQYTAVEEQISKLADVSELHAPGCSTRCGSQVEHHLKTTAEIKSVNISVTKISEASRGREEQSDTKCDLSEDEVDTEACDEVINRNICEVESNQSTDANLDRDRTCKILFAEVVGQKGEKYQKQTGKLEISPLEATRRRQRTGCLSMYRNVSTKNQSIYVEGDAKKSNRDSVSNSLNLTDVDEKADFLKMKLTKGKLKGFSYSSGDISEVGSHNSAQICSSDSGQMNSMFHHKHSGNSSKRQTVKATRRNKIKLTQSQSENLANAKIAEKCEHNLDKLNTKKAGSITFKSNWHTSAEETTKADFIKKSLIINKEKKIIRCSICEKEYKKEIHLKKHVSAQHCDKLSHTCPSCNKQFPYKSRLDRHMKTHAAQKQFPCTECSQAFTAKKYLDNHLRRHDKQPPVFTCGDCGKTFSRRYQLKIHYRTHSGEKPFKCSLCSSHFATAFQVRLHERVHSDVRPFQCRYCGKCFRSNTNLALHVKRHTNDRPYLCATCGAAFYEASKLKAHIRVHTGIQPYMCDQCPKTFKVKHLLVRHLRWHSGDTFKCRHCDRAFDEKWILRAHLQKRHPGL